MDVEDMPYRAVGVSTEFLISREALDEAYSALAGAVGALGDVANLSHAMEKLREARGNHGDTYPGHEPNFVVGGWSEPMPKMPDSDGPLPDEPKLGLATNRQLQDEMNARQEMGHTHPDYRTSGYDGPVA